MPRLRPLLAGLLGAALLLGGPASALPAPAPAPAPAPRVLADLRVGACAGRTVPAGYLGLSVEWSMVQRWAGADLTTAERRALPFVQVLRSLRTQAGGGGVLRIGGDSQDGYRWSPVPSRPGNRLFQGVIDAGMVEAILDVARFSGWKVVLGANLRDGLTPPAVLMARHAAQYDRSSLLGLEVGNEPDAYYPSVEPYVAVFDAYARSLALDPLTRDLPLYGPALATGGDLSWLRSLRQAQGARLAEVTFHHYANRPTLGALFHPAVTQEWQGRIREALRQAGPVPVRVEEANSVGQGGLPRVSDVTGSTPWLVDTLLTGALAGLAGYGLHTWDGADYPLERRTAYYTPFVVRDGAASPRPGFYALALLRDVPGRTFCGVQTRRATGEAVRAWALARGATGQLAVVATNPAGAGHDGLLRIALPVGYAPSGRVSRLRDARDCGGRSAAISGRVLPATGSFTEGSAPVTAVGGRISLAVRPCETVRLDLVRPARG